MKRILGILISLALLTGQLSAQNSSSQLSLDDCIDLALKNRATIIAAVGREQIASAGKRSALGAFLPRVSAQFRSSRSERTNIESRLEGFPLRKSPDQDLSNKSLSATANIEALNVANWFNYAAARAQQASARLDVIASEQDLIFAVKTSYYAYLATVENVTVQVEAVNRAEEQLKLIQSRFDLGSASRSDVLKQKVQHGNDRLTLLRARNSLTTSQSLLAFTIGIDPRQNLKFSTDYVVREYSGNLNDAIEFGLKHRPTLLSMENSLVANQRYVRAAYGSYLPTIGAFVSINTSEGTSGDTVAFDFSSDTRTIGFQVNWNIFDGFFREERITSAKVLRNNARAALVDRRNLTISEIKTAFLDIGQLKEQKDVSEENVESATEELKITQERYNLGAASILDLLDSQVSLKEAQVSLIRVDFDLNLKVAQLEQAMGKM